MREGGAWKDPERIKNGVGACIMVAALLAMVLQSRGAAVHAQRTAVGV